MCSHLDTFDGLKLGLDCHTTASDFLTVECILNWLIFPAAPVSQTLRDFLKRGDVESTATTLVESTDTNGLAHGLQVPPGEQVSRSPERDNDPDVTAAKGFARAALIDGSPAQIRKYATVFLRSILPEGKTTPCVYVSTYLPSEL